MELIAMKDVDGNYHYASKRKQFNGLRIVAIWQVSLNEDEAQEILKNELTQQRVNEILSKKMP